MSRLAVLFTVLILSCCSTLPKPPFGYTTYWKWICGCASDLPASEETDPEAALQQASDYLNRVYAATRQDFKDRNQILEETEKSFRSLGFQLQKETDSQNRTILLRATIDGDIAFKTGSAELTPAALEIVDKFGAALAQNPDTIARVHGHTDTPGSKEMNRRLSLRRAGAVRDAIVKRKGIATERIVEVIGFADDRRVIQTNASEPRNRRTEILIGYKKQ